MSLNEDFEDLFHSLNSVRARYLVVGAYAVIFYTEPRYTKDIDIWVEPTDRNAQKVYQALKHFGAPLQNLRVEDLTNPRLFYQIGMAPNRIDILMSVGNLSFPSAWKKKVVSRYGKEKVYFLDRKDLVETKSSAGRLHDLIDLRLLHQASTRQKRR